MTATITKGEIGEQDINSWDGTSTKTFTRETSTGGTLTLTRVGSEVDALVSYGGGSSFTQATITAALAAIGTTNKVSLVLRPGTWVISSNADWSTYTNVTFKILPGASLSGAFTVTFGAEIDAGSYQIFGSTTLVRGLRSVDPAWWGLVSDGTTSQDTNLATMCTSLGTAWRGVIRIPYKTVFTISTLLNNLPVGAMVLDESGVNGDWAGGTGTELKAWRIISHDAAADDTKWEIISDHHAFMRMVNEGTAGTTSAAAHAASFGYGSGNVAGTDRLDRIGLKFEKNVSNVYRFALRFYYNYAEAMLDNEHFAVDDQGAVGLGGGASADYDLLQQKRTRGTLTENLVSFNNTTTNSYTKLYLQSKNSGNTSRWAIIEEDPDGLLKFYTAASASPVAGIDAAGTYNMGTTGGYLRRTAEATGTAAAAATFNIATNVPTGARILGVQLHVDTALSNTWDAAYNTGSTQTIGSNSAAAKNTKLNKMFDCQAATPITSGVTDITITRNGGGSFTAGGVVRAIVYYEDFKIMADAA